MAEIELDALSKFIEQFKDIDTGALSDLIAKQQELSDKIRDFGGSAAAAEWKDELQNVGDKIEELTANTPAFAKSMIVGFTKMKEMATKSVGQMSQFIHSNMGDIHGAVTDIFQSISGIAPLAGALFSEMGRAALDPLTDSSEKVSATFGSTVGKANEAIKKLLQTQNVARSAYIAAGEGMDVANKAASEYTQSLRRMTIMTGISGKDLNTLSKELSILGTEAFENATKGLYELSGGLVNQGMTAPAAAATAFRGLGFEIGEATTFMKQGFMKFGEGAMETAKTVGDFADAADKTGYSTLNVVEPIRRASEALAIFGRGSTAAAGMWTTFTKSLRDDVPLEQTNQMVQQLTSNLANMKIQERAFISMISGLNQGATALGGGLKMELAMRTEGGMQKNFEALTESLRKFGGGQIITIEQAANNPQLEMQFQVQRQMLGRLAGITNQEQQNRMLEVMQQVQSGGMSQIDGSKKMSEVFEAGQTLQQKEITFLENIAKNTALLVAGTADKKLTKLDETFSNTPKQLLAFGARMPNYKPGMELGGEGGQLLMKQQGKKISDSGIFREMKEEWGKDFVQAGKGAVLGLETFGAALKGKYLPENISARETPVTELPTGNMKLSGVELGAPSLSDLAKQSGLGDYEALTAPPASLRTDNMMRAETLRPAPTIEELSRQMRASEPDIAGTRIETIPEMEGGRGAGAGPTLTLDINPIRINADDDSIKGLAERIEFNFNKSLSDDRDELVKLMVQSNRGVPSER